MSLFMTPLMRRAVANAKDGDCRGAKEDLQHQVKMNVRRSEELPRGFAWDRAKKAVAKRCGRALGLGRARRAARR